MSPEPVSLAPKLYYLLPKAHRLLGRCQPRSVVRPGRSCADSQEWEGACWDPCPGMCWEIPLPSHAALPCLEGRVKCLPCLSWITEASSLLLQPGSPRKLPVACPLPLHPNFLPSLVLSPHEGCTAPSSSQSCSSPREEQLEVEI